MLFEIRSQLACRLTVGAFELCWCIAVLQLFMPLQSAGNFKLVFTLVSVGVEAATDEVVDTEMNKVHVLSQPNRFHKCSFTSSVFTLELFLDVVCLLMRIQITDMFTRERAFDPVVVAVVTCIVEDAIVEIQVILQHTLAREFSFAANMCTRVHCIDPLFLFDTAC